MFGRRLTSISSIVMILIAGFLVMAIREGIAEGG